MWCTRTRPEVLQATSSCVGCSVVLLLLDFASLPLKCYSHISVRPSVLTAPRISGLMGIDLVSSSTFQGVG